MTLRNSFIYWISTVLIVLYGITGIWCATPHHNDIAIDPTHSYTIYGSSDSAVQLDILVDLLCPYSANTYHTVNQLTKHYRQMELAINIIVFVLPYHRNSWMTALGTEIVSHYNKSNTAVRDYFTDIFAEQDQLGMNELIHDCIVYTNTY